MNANLMSKIHETMKGLRFGVEIEYTGISREDAAEVVAKALGGTHDRGYRIARMTDGRQWKVTSDASVHGSFENRGGEVVTPILTWSDMDALQAVIRALRAAGARTPGECCGTHSCGIHVHVDGARFQPASLRALTKLVFKRQDVIETMLGIRGTERCERYCKSLSSTTVERIARANDRASLADAWYNDAARDRRERSEHYHHSRYQGLNLHSYFYRGTVEFRYFNSTLHAGEVKAYVQFCLAMAARALNSSLLSKREGTAVDRAAVNSFLNVLGLIGDDFKTARRHLTKRLAGAARRSRLDRDEEATTVAAPQQEPVVIRPVAAPGQRWQSGGQSVGIHMRGQEVQVTSVERSRSRVNYRYVQGGEYSSRDTETFQRDFIFLQGPLPAAPTYANGLAAALEVSL